MSTRIVQYPSEVLRRQCEPLDIEAEQDSIRRISKALRYAVINIDDAYAVAAPQIGITKRIFAYQRGSMVASITNPTILEYSDETTTSLEGCLSIPGKFFQIERANSVLVSGFDLQGREITREFTDITARIFQHEIDHLNGKLIVDLLSDEEKAELLDGYTG